MIHRLRQRGARKYGKARTLCGRDVEGQIHPQVEFYSDQNDGEGVPFETECQGCARDYDGAVAESRARAGYRTVHVLFHGLPLCGYGEGRPPGEWPADQAWLAVTELGRHGDDLHWCAPCLEKARAGNLQAVAIGTNVLDHMREPKASRPPPAPKNHDDGMRRFDVWSLRTIGQGGVDVRVGRAIENRDGSFSLELPDLGVRLKLKPSV